MDIKEIKTGGGQTMLCNDCKCKNNCGWYGSYNRIETEIYTGIGTDNTLGRALLATMKDHPMKQCAYFEQNEKGEIAHS